MNRIIEKDDLETLIKTEACDLEDFLVGVRRHLHKHPELSHQEYETTSYIASILEDEGVHVTRWDDCTGMIAEVRGNRETPVIALRGELDGIGVDDKKEVSYASTVPDVMHACGHDLHSTIVLGTAIVCQRLRQYLNGSVRFIFQPAEEVVPGGSLEMIDKDAMKGLDAIIGFHADPFLKLGDIGLKEGMLTAGADLFDITIIGKSGHTARPHQAKDTVLCAAKVVESLYQLVDREVDPREPFVLSVGKIQCGHTPNAIPETADISGTVRMLSKETQERMPALLERVIHGITGSMDIAYRFEYHQGSPPVNNDPGIIKLIGDLIQGSFKDSTIVQMEQSMGGEDFSWYLEHVPGTLVRIGTSINGGGPALHSNIFDVNEKVIPLAVRLFSSVVTEYVDRHDR